MDFVTSDKQYPTYRLSWQKLTKDYPAKQKRTKLCFHYHVVFFNMVIKIQRIRKKA